MTPVTILTFLHIATMFGVIAVALGSAVLLRVAARSGNVRSIQGVAEAAVSVARFIAPAFIVGGIFGLATAIVTGYNLLTPWLVIAYVLFAFGAAIGALGEGRWTAQVAAAAAADPGATPGAALAAVLAAPLGNQAMWGFIVVLAALIFDMVVKPFS